MYVAIGQLRLFILDGKLNRRRVYYFINRMYPIFVINTLFKWLNHVTTAQSLFITTINLIICQYFLFCCIFLPPSIIRISYLPDQSATIIAIISIWTLISLLVRSIRSFDVIKFWNINNNQQTHNNNNCIYVCRRLCNISSAKVHDDQRPEISQSKRVTQWPEY